MRFRPRFSLRSLFLITTAASIGAAWWHGPHEFEADRLVAGDFCCPTLGQERYTAYRDLLGNHIRHGLSTVEFYGGRLTEEYCHGQLLGPIRFVAHDGTMVYNGMPDDAKFKEAFATFRNKLAQRRHAQLMAAKRRAMAKEMALSQLSNAVQPR